MPTTLPPVESMSREELLAEFAWLQADLARRKLLAFTAYTMPTYQPNWHHVRLAQELDDVLAGKTRRLIVNMPPQHGKSELVSRRFPAYILGCRPEVPIIHASYNADLAKDMSREVQSIIDTPAYRALFPKTRLASGKDAEVRMAAQFDVVGHAGSYRAAGVGQGITGKSMLIGLIDDPVKSRAEAESEAYRRAVWNWYVSDFRTRAMGDACAIVLVQTRWHTDDLAGRLLDMAEKNPLADQWRVVSFPGVCDERRPDDPRQLDEALWPSRFSRAGLEATRIGSGIYDWSALYQQRPVPEGGAMAQRSWFTVFPVRPGSVRRRVRSWDLAATLPTAGRDPDWTVGTLLAEVGGPKWVVEHVVRQRVTPGLVDALMLQTARMDGRHVLIREWQDPGQAGKAVIAAHRLMLAGYDYEAVLASGEKTMQWRPLLVQAEGGNVGLVAGEWNREWLDELSLVPYGKHDDQADSAALGFNCLTGHKDYGPMVAAILPGTQTVGGPRIGSWREEYFRR